MTTQLFVNMSVSDLRRSKEFFSNLGFKFHPDYTDDNAVCLIINDNSYVMLLEEKFFNTFTYKNICDAHKNIETIIALSTDSRDTVNRIADTAIDLGAMLHEEPLEHGGRYQRTFQDLDGHLWQINYSDIR